MTISYIELWGSVAASERAQTEHLSTDTITLDMPKCILYEMVPLMGQKNQRSSRSESTPLKIDSCLEKLK